MIWLIGCKGMLGTEVSNQFDKNNFSWIGTDREVDITNYESLEDFANKNSSIDGYSFRRSRYRNSVLGLGAML